MEIILIAMLCGLLLLVIGAQLWLRRVARDWGLELKWWHGPTRIHRGIEQRILEPTNHGTKARLLARLYTLTGGCLVRLETEPGRVRAVEASRDELVPAPCEVSVETPRHWWWREW